MKTLCCLIAVMLMSVGVVAEQPNGSTNYYSEYPRPVCPDPEHELAQLRKCVKYYIAGANRDTYRIERSMKLVRWRNDELVRSIRADQTGYLIAPDLYGASNLDYPEYPKPTCVEPIAESEVKEYHLCVSKYSEAAENDAARIRRKKSAARKHRPSNDRPEDSWEGTPFEDRHYGSSNNFDPRYPPPDCPGPERPEHTDCITRYIEAASNDQERVAQSIFLAQWRNDEVIRAIRGIDVQEQLLRGPYPTSNLDYVEYPEPECPEPADEHGLFEYHDCIRAYLEAAENDVERLEEAMKAARRLRIQAEKAHRVID